MELTGRKGGVVGDTSKYWQEISGLSGQNRDAGNFAGEDDVRPDGDVMKKIGADVLRATVHDAEKGEQFSEEEKQIRERFDEWRESMAGTPEEYWHKLEKKWWVDEGVAIDYYAMPRVDMLMGNARKFLRKRMPEMNEAVMEARAELATKVALQGLAEQEVEMLQRAKTDRKGERKMKKGWAEALLHRAYEAMKEDLEDIYSEDAEWPIENEQLGEAELMTWWATSEPENEWAKRGLEHLKATEVEEATESAEEPLVRMSEDDAEVVYEPERPKTLDDLDLGEKPTGDLTEKTSEREGLIRKILQGLTKGGFAARVDQAVAEAAAAAIDVGTELVPVFKPKTEVIAEQAENEVKEPEVNMEQLGQDEVLERAIAMVGQAVQVCEEQISLLEDYNPAKPEMVQELNSLKVSLIKLQSMYRANRSDFEEGKRQREAGLENDEVEVGDSDILRHGEIVFERLVASGLLKRGELAEANLAKLRGLRVKLREELDRVTMELKNEQDSYFEYLRMILDVEPYLVWLAEREADEKARMDEDDEIISYPTEVSLKDAE